MIRKKYMTTLQKINEVVHKAIPNVPTERPEFRRPEEQIQLARKELDSLAMEHPHEVAATILKLPQMQIESFANVLASIGEPAVEQVWQYVIDEDRKVTSHLVRVMGVLADERFVDPIIDLLMPILTSMKQGTRQQIIRQRTHIHYAALRGCGAEKALERLIPIIDDDSVDKQLKYSLRYIVNQLRKR